MSGTELAAQVAGIAALADPIRRDLYLYVVGQPTSVSRDEASERLGVARHTAKFHLDKLVEEGLLVTEYRRLSGRRGPGAGRPTKFYARSARQLSVSLPERRYDLAGKLMAQGIEDSAREGTAVLDALQAVAADLGGRIGVQASAEAGASPSRDQLVTTATRILAAHGYEPRREGQTITLANCPFDVLAREYPTLVCGMNLALLGAAADRLGNGTLTARLVPAADRCCVVLTAS